MSISADIAGLSLAASIRMAIAGHEQSSIARVYLYTYHPAQTPTRARGYVRVVTRVNGSTGEKDIHDHPLSHDLAGLLSDRSREATWWVYHADGDLNLTSDLPDDDEICLDTLQLEEP